MLNLTFIFFLLTISCYGQENLTDCSKFHQLISKLEKEITDSTKDFDFISPEFDGDIEALYEIITNPPLPSSGDTSVHGKVILSFVVDTTGSLHCYKIENTLNPDFDKQALIYFTEKDLKFTPGRKVYKKKTIKVPVRMMIPIIYD